MKLIMSLLTELFQLLISSYYELLYKKAVWKLFNKKSNTCISNLIFDSSGQPSDVDKYFSRKWGTSNPKSTPHQKYSCGGHKK